LVTGATGGIGAALARVLAAEGHDLTVVARGRDRLLALGDQLRAGGAGVLEVDADLAEPGAAERVTAAHVARFGRLDVLVNTVGIGMAGPLAEQSERAVELQITLNLRVPIAFYRAASEHLAAAAADRGCALVLLIGSYSGAAPLGGLAVYSATKRALTGLAEAMNRELGEQGVKSTVFSPGYVRTEMTEAFAGNAGSGPMLEPADLAEALRFLLRTSPQCVIPELHFLRPGLRM
jgi:short-subunit dehydrogenase